MAFKSSARELPAYPTPCSPSSHNSSALVMKSAPHCALFLTLSSCGCKTCFPYCHYWGYCNGLITSFPCQVFQRELNQAPPPPPCVRLAHFIPTSLFSVLTAGSRTVALAQAEECLLSVFRSLSGRQCRL